MSNIIQVVEVEPTEHGQWVTFWHLGARTRLSGEFSDSSYVVTFDRGDLYVCLSISPEEMSCVGPHPVDLLKGCELATLPLVPDQNLYMRHDKYSRYDLDRENAIIKKVGLQAQLKSVLGNKSPEQTLKEIARLN